jgi:hypothetical protein
MTPRNMDGEFRQSAGFIERRAVRLERARDGTKLSLIQREVHYNNNTPLHV